MHFCIFSHAFEGVNSLFSSSGTSASPYFAADSAWYLGCKLYEIGNHLGNVVSVISDRKQAFDTDMDDEADYYEPVVLSATDYYPFGFEMPGRKYNIGNYRYGFNGKEADRKKEWASFVHYDYGFRIYNPALGRFLSVDPLTREYPMLTPYQFASNSPIANVDLDGLESFYAADGRFLRKFGDSPEIRVMQECIIKYHTIVLTEEFNFDLFYTRPNSFNCMISEKMRKLFEENNVTGIKEFSLLPPHRVLFRRTQCHND